MMKQLDTESTVRVLHSAPDCPSQQTLADKLGYSIGKTAPPKSLKPSKRGETEITDVNKAYMQKDELQMVKLGRGFAWLDTGTHEALLQASHFVETIEKRQGYKIACLEKIAYRLGYINSATLEKNIAAYGKSQYADYLKEFCANY